MHMMSDANHSRHTRGYTFKVIYKSVDAIPYIEKHKLHYHQAENLSSDWFLREILSDNNAIQKENECR